MNAQRLVWVDWLKGLVVLGVVAFHAAQPYVVTDWIVNATEDSYVLSGLAGLGYLFAMPLMFLLAGVTGWIALERRTTWQYLRVRLLDVFVGDWDRHYKQFEWAQAGEEGPWTPFPKDRDQAFSRYDGVLLWMARKRSPLGLFDEKYPNVRSSTASIDATWTQ